MQTSMDGRDSSGIPFWDTVERNCRCDRTQKGTLGAGRERSWRLDPW